MADEDEAKVRSLLIPVKNSDQEVEVFVDELPDDVNDVIDILRAEVAPLDVWLKFAVRSPVRCIYHAVSCAVVPLGGR